MAKDQPPFTPEQARALSRRQPKTSGTFQAGSSNRSGDPGTGHGGAAKKLIRRPGMSKDTGPESGRHNR
jgi:hypothetical protein